MQFSFSAPTPLEYFSSLLQQQPRLPLLECAISLGQDVDAGLDVQAALCEVDRMQGLLKQCVPGGSGALQRVYLLNQFFYEDMGFAANPNDFYDPGNSFVHQVLRTRRGIPISLGVLWLELARGLGLEADGISFPGHFLVKVQVPEGVLVQDPLTGQGLSLGTLAERLAPFHEQWGLAPDEEPPLPLYLQAASDHAILARMLRNLKRVYQDQGLHEALLAVMNRLIALSPEDWGEYRDRGLALAGRGAHREAVSDLQTYVRHAESAVDVQAIEEQLRQLRMGLS